jgi:hypothetical protein
MGEQGFVSKNDRLEKPIVKQRTGREEVSGIMVWYLSKQRAGPGGFALYRVTRGLYQARARFQHDLRAFLAELKKNH